MLNKLLKRQQSEAKRAIYEIYRAEGTVRLRTDQTRGCVSKDTILLLVFKLVESAQKRWLRIRGFKHLDDMIEGVPL